MIKITKLTAEVRVLREKGFFSLRHGIKILPADHRTSYLMSTWDFALGVKTTEV
jgi:hypothetical protein